MIRAKKLHWNERNDPTLTIVVTGVHDVYRFTHHMTQGQCEFADVGFRVQRRLARKLQRNRWRDLKRYMHGDGYYT